MKIPPDAIIPEEKLTRYLLLPRVKDDKSRFLAQAGFMLPNWRELLAAIRRLTESAEAVEEGNNEYGDFYRLEGELEGPNGHLAVVMIWLRWHQDGAFHFITLKPQKE